MLAIDGLAGLMSFVQAGVSKFTPGAVGPTI